MKYLINHCEYSRQELLILCKNKLVDSYLWEKDIYIFIQEWFDDKDYVIGHSSGTTGPAKEMKLLKDRMRLSAKRTVDFLKLKPKSTALLSLSTNYIAGKMLIVRALEHGLDLITNEPSMDSLLKLDEHIDFAALVPYQVSQMVESNINSLMYIKTLIIGGAEVDKLLIDKLKYLPTLCYSTYGMTETLSHIALKQLNGNCPNKYYKTMEGVDISQDKRGCLQVIAFDKEILTTNDIVELHSKETFEWIGRYDNIINSGGLKFVPEQIEAKIKPLLSCRYIITSVKDDKLGNRIILLLEGNSYPTNKLEKQLKEILTKYEMPKEILFIAKLKETSSGKIIRKEY